MNKKRFFLGMLLAMFFTGIFQTNIAYAGAADSFDGIVGLLRDAVQSLGPKDYLNKQQKNQIALNFWEAKKSRMNFGKPLEPFDIYGQGLIILYECTFNGQDSVVVIPTVWINDSPHIQTAAILPRAKFYELAQDKEKLKKMFAATYPQYYSVPDEQSAQTTKPPIGTPTSTAK